MTDTENVFDGFALLGDDEEFDVDKIFGSGSDEPAPPPPAPTLAEEVKPQFDPEQVQTETAESQPEPEQTFPAKTQDAPAEEEKQPLELFSAFTSAESDPIPEAAPVKSIAPRPQTQLSLFDKPPVFQYGGAREQITDSDMTFEALRIQNAALAQNRDVLELRRIEVEHVKAERWNGALPTAVYAGAPIPFFNPQGAAAK